MSPAAKMPGTVVARLAGGRPSRQALGRDVAPGQHEPALVASDLVGQPLAVRVGPEEQEQSPDLAAVRRAAGDVLDVHPLQPSVTTPVDHAGAAEDLDAGVVADLVDQVVRHRGRQVGTPDHDGDRAGEAGQVHGGLAGAVAAADHDDVGALHLAGRGHGGAVVDAVPDQGVEGLDADPAVGHAGRDHHGAGVHVAALGADDVRLPVGPRLERDDRPAGEEAGAEADRLVAGALGQPHPGDAAGEAEVVADHGAGAGLAADRLALDGDGGEPLAGGVHAGGEPGRAGADDHQVDDLVDLDVVGTAVEGHREVAGGARHERLGGREGLHDGPPVRLADVAGEDVAAVVAVGVEDAARQPDALEVVAQLQGQDVVLGRDDADRHHLRHRDGGRPVVEQVDDRAVELLVADPARHEQERVVLAGGLAGTQGLGVAAEVLVVGDHDAAGRRDRLPDLGDGGVDLHVGQLGLDDEQRHLAARAQDVERLVLGVGRAGGESGRRTRGRSGRTAAPGRRGGCRRPG